MKILFHICLLVLPWCIRRRILCWAFGYKIDPTAKIGLSIVMPRRLEMGPHCYIGHLTFCKWEVDSLVMKESCTIGSSVMITGISTANKAHFQHVPDRRCEMVLEKCVGIPSRKFFDCNGGIYIGAYTTVAGQWSQFLTHGIDIYNSRQDARPINIGKYCFIGSGCIILPGAKLPDYCVLGAGSVLNKELTESWCVYAGAPATMKKQLDPVSVPWMHRDSQAIA